MEINTVLYPVFLNYCTMTLYLIVFFFPDPTDNKTRNEWY